MFSESAPVVLIATSGSTGMPKLVCHSLENLFKAAQKAIDQAAIDSSDSILLSLSPSSMGGFINHCKSISIRCNTLFKFRSLVTFTVEFNIKLPLNACSATIG